MAVREAFAGLMRLLGSFNYAYAVATSNITRRAFGLEGPPYDKPVRGLWPKWRNEDGTYDDSRHPVTYCFEDKRASQQLVQVTVQAIAIWKPVTLYSSMDIIPAPYCKWKKRGSPKYDCVCRFDKHDDEFQPLVIRLDDRIRRSTIGYRYHYKRNPSIARNLDTPNQFKFLFRGAEASEREWDDAMSAMAHELGHAMGLRHEHQRPDSFRFLDFERKDLAGYGDAVELATKDKFGFFDETVDIKQRMEFVCSDKDASEAYFPRARGYVVYDHKDDMTNNLYGIGYTPNAFFDFGSIMIYPSQKVYTDENDEYDKWVLKRKPSSDKRPITPGGSADLAKTAISAQDIMGAARGYPDKAKEKKLGELFGERKPLPVTMGRFLTTTITAGVPDGTSYPVKAVQYGAAVKPGLDTIKEESSSGGDSSKGNGTEKDSNGHSGRMSPSLREYELEREFDAHGPFKSNK